MLYQLKLQSLSLFFFLLLFVRYGYHISKNSYFICYDQEIIRSLFERLRNYGGQKESYPTECGRFSISAVRDLTTGYDSNQPNNRAVSAQLICDLTYSFYKGLCATKMTYCVKNAGSSEMQRLIL